MNLCDSGHVEICFETRDCPFCNAIASKDAEILKLEERVEDLEEKIDELEAKE